MAQHAEHMELEREEGGLRHYLGGRPVHAGDQLKLWIDGEWKWARYESRGKGRATLYLAPRTDVPAEVAADERLIDLTPAALLRWPETWE